METTEIFKWSRISGNREKAQVIFNVINEDLRLLFRFDYDPRAPKGRLSRIVVAFFQVAGVPQDETYPDRGTLVNVIKDLIREVWPDCTTHAGNHAADALVQIYEDPEHGLSWRICYESAFSKYTDHLLSLEQVAEAAQRTDGDEEAASNNQGLRHIPVSLIANEAAMEQIAFKDLTYVSHPGADFLSISIARTRSEPETRYVFKGLEYYNYLYKPAKLPRRVDMLYHEIETIMKMPPHPNMKPHPVKLVIQKARNVTSEKELICGTLTPVSDADKTLNHIILSAHENESYRALNSIVLWCKDMAYAVAHTHLVAHTFHMNLNPSSFVWTGPSKRPGRLILVDWEQCKACKYTNAPEADGTWDLDEPAEDGSVTQRLTYTKSTRPRRVNKVYNYPNWNVFPVWMKSNPMAVEAAEVFSLGRTMWMLLQGVPRKSVENLEEVKTFWNEASDDIPQNWKNTIDKCMDLDPNNHPRLQELLGFWEKQYASVTGSGGIWGEGRF